MQQTTTTPRRRLPCDAISAALVPVINNVLKPALRAYAFGHVSTTGPKLAGLLLGLFSSKRSMQQHIIKLRHILRNSLGIRRFPAFCATLVGLYSLLSNGLLAAVRAWRSSSQPSRPGSGSLFATAGEVRLARFLAACVACWAAFPLVNGGDARYQPLGSRSRSRSEAALAASLTVDGTPVAYSAPRVDAAIPPSAAPSARSSSEGPRLAGKTLDLTILASARAVETLVWHIWRRRYCGGSGSPTPRIPRMLAASSDAALFIGSCYAIMFAWFYSPDSLPSSYRRWIGQAAGVDSRLVEVLRKARWGSFVYGVDTGQGYVLESMCREHGWPLSWGEPATDVPVRCEMVHQGTGPSCHWHKAVKFWRVWQFAMRMYLPLQLLIRARRPSTDGLRRAVVEAARSSAFLAAFVSLFYYGVCLSRTLIGPRLLSLRTVSRQDWDAGYCVAAGSALCGWSILLEPARRRQELALFVAPRAASVFLPRRYDRQYLNRERTAFAAGVGVLFSLAHEDPKNVRGILGSLISAVIAS